MKAIYLITVVMLLWSGSLVAQSMKNSFSLSAGPSFPVGKFAQSSASDFSAGNAATGKTVQLSYGHDLFRNFGFVVSAYYQQNALSARSFSNSLSLTGFFENYYRHSPFDPHDSPPRYYGNWTTKNSSWRTAALLAGVYKRIPLDSDNKLSLTAKVSAGAAFAKADSIAAFSYSDTAYAEFGLSKFKGTSAAILLGGTISYRLSSRVDIIVAVKYFATGKIPVDEGVEAKTATDGGLRQPGVHDITNGRLGWLRSETVTKPERAMMSLNTTAGIAFHF